VRKRGATAHVGSLGHPLGCWASRRALVNKNYAPFRPTRPDPLRKSPWRVIFCDRRGLTGPAWKGQGLGAHRGAERSKTLNAAYARRRCVAADRRSLAGFTRPSRMTPIRGTVRGNKP
jgi:hypothetical protein